MEEDFEQWKEHISSDPHGRYTLLSAGINLIRPRGELLPTYILNPHAFDLASLAVAQACTVSDSW